MKHLKTVLATVLICLTLSSCAEEAMTDADCEKMGDRMWNEYTPPADDAPAEEYHAKAADLRVQADILRDCHREATEAEFRD